MNCLAGVDEAGLGPILGPLVIAGAALRGPAGIDPWRGLDGAVSRGADRKRLQVADSKKVKTGKHGLARLERTVLAFLGVARGRVPATLGDWLDGEGVDVEELYGYPWYGDLELPLPVAADAAEIELFAHRLERALAAADIELAELCVRPVEVLEWNALIAATDNKSTTHLRLYGEVLARLVDGLPDGAHVVADRCGGRVHYARFLRERWPGARVRTLREDEDVSRYDLEHAGTTAALTFATSGEERAFPTALASCAAKYLRELMVRCLNRWFAERVPGLRPTAGYYQDGRRFLRDVEALTATGTVPMERLVRVR